MIHALDIAPTVCPIARNRIFPSQRKTHRIWNMKIVYIGFFGVLGVFSRYFMDIVVGKYLPTPFPFGTFFTNLLGALVIGVIYVLGVERAALSADVRIGVMVGFLGAFIGAVLARKLTGAWS